MSAFAQTADLFTLALCLWREARGEGRTGMIAVGCVIRNRVAAHGSCYYEEVVRHLQFSSLTAPGDPELDLWPVANDAAWQDAQAISADVIAGHIQDITGGATLYYADTMPFPSTWDRTKVRETIQIGKHLFFVEI